MCAFDNSICWYMVQQRVQVRRRKRTWPRKQRMKKKKHQLLKRRFQFQPQLRMQIRTLIMLKRYLKFPKQFWMHFSFSDRNLKGVLNVQAQEQSVASPSGHLKTVWRGKLSAEYFLFIKCTLSPPFNVSMIKLYKCSSCNTLTSTTCFSLHIAELISQVTELHFCCTNASLR